MTPPGPTPAAPAPTRQWTVGTLTYTAGGLAALFCWLLLGDFAWQMRERSAAPVVQLLLKKFQASDFFTGFVLQTVPWAVILVVGPAVSYWSDRLRSRWGRRIPFVFVPAPFVTAAMLGLAYGPAIGRTVHAALGGAPEAVNHTILLVLASFWTVFEIGVVVSNSVFNGLINDVVPRVMLGRFYGLFRAVGLGAGILFNYKIIGHAEESYTVILASIGIAYGIGLTAMCLRVREGDYPPPPPVSPGSSNPLAGALRDYLRDCFSKPYYLLVFVFLGVANVSFVPVNLFSLYTAKSYGMSMATYGKYMVLTFSCSFALAYPLGWLADRIHPVRLALGALGTYAACMAIGFAALHDPRSFGVVFLAHGVLSGAFYTGTAAIAQMLFPQLKFAQFAAAAGLIAALFNMLVGPALGAVLDALHHNYRYTFLAGSLIAATALGLGFLVYHRWVRLGGSRNYVAPE